MPTGSALKEALRGVQEQETQRARVEESARIVKEWGRLQRLLHTKDRPAVHTSFRQLAQRLPK